MLARLRMPIALALVALLVLALMSAASAQAPKEPGDAGEPLRTIHVSGVAQAQAQPDRGVISLGVQTQAEVATEAIAQNNEAMQAVITALTEAGVAEEDIQTQLVQLQPQYQSPDEPTTRGQGQIIGYMASNTVRITVRDLEQMGALLDVAVQAGANVVHGLGFEISEVTLVVDRALELAMQDARRKAELLAAQADAELGPVLSITETSRVPGPVAEVAGRGGAAPVPIQPGTETIEAQVSVTWLLQ